MKALIRIPKLGMSMTEARLVEWLAPDGSTVVAGAPLYLIETDKSIQEVDAPVAGKLQVIAQAGTTYDVGHLVARIEVA